MTLEAQSVGCVCRLHRTAHSLITRQGRTGVQIISFLLSYARSDCSNPSLPCNTAVLLTQRGVAHAAKRDLRQDFKNASGSRGHYREVEGAGSSPPLPGHGTEVESAGTAKAHCIGGADVWECVGRGTCGEGWAVLLGVQGLEAR